MMSGYGMAGGFGWIFMVLWWVLIAVGIFALVKWIGSNAESARTGGSGRALSMLKERYARGEIDEQEFHKRKRDLTD